MAKVVITLEDVENEGHRGATFAMYMDVTDADRELASNHVTAAAAVGFAVRSLWRSGTLIAYARENIDDLVEEAAIENALNERAAQTAVKPNISKTGS